MKNLIIFSKKLYSGRIGRNQYFIGMLMFYVLTVLGVVFVSAFKGSYMILYQSIIAGIVFSLFSIISLVFLFFVLLIGWSLTIRRWHDIGCSGYMVLLNLFFVFIPIIPLVLSISLFFVPGNKESNKYGQPVKSYNILDIFFNRKITPNLQDKYINIISILVSITFVALVYFIHFKDIQGY